MGQSSEVGWRDFEGIKVEKFSRSEGRGERIRLCDTFAMAEQFGKSWMTSIQLRPKVPLGLKKKLKLNSRNDFKGY